MPAGSDDGKAEFDELTRRLTALEAAAPPEPSPLDRIISRLGEAELVVSLALVIFTPFDSISAILGMIGGVTWTYERFVREKRQLRDEVERRRRIDLLRSEIDRLNRL